MYPLIMSYSRVSAGAGRSGITDLPGVDLPRVMSCWVHQNPKPLFFWDRYLHEFLGPVLKDVLIFAVFVKHARKRHGFSGTATINLFQKMLF